MYGDNHKSSYPRLSQEVVTPSNVRKLEPSTLKRL
jgi:hypothetical protein